MKLTSSPGVHVPWDEPEWFGGVFPIRVLAELERPVGDSFPDSNGRKGVRFGFNNTALQHIFEEIPPDVAERIAAVFEGHRVTGSTGVPFVSPVPPHGVVGPAPFDVDPDAIDRGLIAHYNTVETLAAWVGAKGWQPLLPAPGEPRYDLAWLSADVINVAEVKSTTDENREMQLRLGLGQVLRYRQSLSNRGRKVKAWLVAESVVADPSWSTTCSDVGVRLTWPEALR